MDLNNGDSYPLLPVDGLLDQRRERFEWRTEQLDPGEYVATVNATDREGNTATGKTIFVIEE